MKFKNMVQLYLYNEIENWEWSYEDLYYQMISEFDWKDSLLYTDSISDNQAQKTFETILEKEIKCYVEFSTIATDDMNDKIKQELKIILEKEKII